jgi:hypothetical protein
MGKGLSILSRWLLMGLGFLIYFLLLVWAVAWLWLERFRFGGWDEGW